MIKTFIDKLYKEAAGRGLSDFEIYYKNQNEFSLETFEGEIDKYSLAESGGISLRVILNGKCGYSYTENFTDESIDLMIKNAVENTEILENEEKEFISNGGRYELLSLYTPELSKVNSDLKIKKAVETDKYCKQQDNRIDKVSIYYGDFDEAKSIRNSKGIDISENKNGAYLYISVIAKENGTTKSGGQLLLSKEFEKLDYKKCADDAVSEALAKFGAEPVLSGEYGVIFENRAFANMLSAMSGIFSAENVLKGLSLLKGKVGEEIAVPFFNLVDNPHLETGFGSSAFDDEGVPTKTKYLIKDGCLKTYLHNQKTAAAFGVESTGNGVKDSYKSSIGISPFNLYVEKGSLSFDSLAAELGNGILIKEVAGLHSGLNSVSGDFSLQSEGFLIENGKITKPVYQITVSGNFFSLIKNIKAVGSDLEFNMSGRIGSPSVLAGTLSIGGK